MDGDTILSKNKGRLQNAKNLAQVETKIGDLRPEILLLILNMVLTIQANHTFQNY